MEEIDYGGPERRRYFRLSYPPDARPTFKVRTHELEVLEVSEKGLRFLNDKEVKLAEWVRGTILFHDGELLFLKADTVVLAVGFQSENKLIGQLKGLVPEIYAVGDCLEPRDILAAINEASVVGRAI